MHTAMIILGGLALLAVFVGIARLIGKPFRAILPLYLVAWFFGAGVNVWIGVTQAGYTLMQELPVFLVTFGVPAIVAVLLSRKL